MLKENLNYLLKRDIKSIIDYLNAFYEEVTEKYKIDAEELSQKLGFELFFFDIKELNVNSYLRHINDNFVIGVNDKLDEYNKNFQIFKEIISYFIIRYYFESEDIDETHSESDFYFYDSKSEVKTEIDTISNYYSCLFLEKSCFDKKSIKENNNNLKKYRKKIKKLVNKE